MSKRAKGYYWVFIESGAGYAWEVARWDGHEWYCYGTAWPIYDEDIRRIGEKIKRVTTKPTSTLHTGI